MTLPVYDNAREALRALHADVVANSKKPLPTDSEELAGAVIVWGRMAKDDELVRQAIDIKHRALRGFSEALRQYRREIR